MMSGISAQTTWKAYDVGGDGTVSQAEFIGVVKQLLSDDSGEDGGPAPPHGQPGHAHRQWYSNVGKDRHGRVLRVSEADLRGVFVAAGESVIKCPSSLNVLKDTHDHSFY